MPLWYLGAPPTEPTSLANVNYVNSLVGQSLSKEEVKQEIKDRFSLASYALVSDADAIINNADSNQAFARQSNLTSLLTNKIAALSSGQKSRANGPILLDSTGKVDAALISGVVSGQRHPQLYWTPASYTQKSNVTTEQTVCTIPVTSNLSAYKVFVTGSISAKVSVDGDCPVINVRVGSSSGAIVAKGYGVAENYKGGSLTALSTASLPLWGYTQPSVLASSSYTYTIPAWCSKIDVVLIGGGGGGYDGSLGFINGGGGGAGAWLTTTLTRGSNLASGAIALSGEIGQGAAHLNPTKNSNGGPTTCIIPGGSTLSAAGGETGKNHHPGFPSHTKDGDSAGNVTFDGITYLGGEGATTLGANGSAPGGGGAGGKGNLLNGDNGGNGAAGAAFFYAYVADDNNYGQIGVVPTPMNTQTTLTAPTTLYVNVVRTSSGAVSTDSFSPQIAVMAVPA